MKIKLVPISDKTVAKLYYRMKTGYKLYRTFSEDNRGMNVVIIKEGASKDEGAFERTMELGETFSALLPDLQLYLNSSETPVKGFAEITSIEFLSSEHHSTSFILPYSEYKALEEALAELKSEVVYTKAVDFYNDLITV